MDANFITLTSHVLAEQKKFPAATGDMTMLLCAIQTAVKAVSYAVRKAGILNLFGTVDRMNVQGEEVKKLDVLANELFINLLKSSFTTCILVSEEEENIVVVEPARQGKYIVCFDPLDGSTNVECLVSIGTIFAIFQKEDKDYPSVRHVLRHGNDIVAAGYVIYGTATMMILSLGSTVDGFMLDPSIGEFILTNKNIKMPNRGQIYSINESYERSWTEGIREYIHSKKDASKGKPYGARYVGSMVADLHRTLLYGGIFLYPPTQEHTKGKLRLLYECAPMAFIITKAGGLATNGKIPILDIIPKNIHDRTPIYLGSKGDVEDLLVVIRKYEK